MALPADNQIIRELSSPSGLHATLNGNGSLRRLDCGAIVLSLFIGNEMEGGPANLYLRRHADRSESIPLLGPSSPTRFDARPEGRTLWGSGRWGDIDYVVELTLAADAPVWFWRVYLENHGSVSHTLDLTYAQDLALAPYGAIRLNEYYVSQYLDHTPLSHPERGTLIASRQNLAVDGRIPWSLIGSLQRAATYATDALQFYGVAGSAGPKPSGVDAELPARRLQHEHSMAVLRDAPIRLAANERVTCGFFGMFVADHPEATSPADLQRVARVFGLPEATRAAPPHRERALAESDTRQTLFSTAPALAVLDLSHTDLEKLFKRPWRHLEVGNAQELLSFFCGADSHVVLAAKERRVLRPHGHILRSGRHTTPDESALTSTAWMNGVFHSMLTQGHVSINRLLSTVHSYLGLLRSHGQRMFVQIGGVWQRLEMPSAFEMAPSACAWIYRYAEGEIQVRAAAQDDPHTMTLEVLVTAGPPLRFLISHHLALNGDDGSAPGAARWQETGEDILLMPPPGSELAQRFPRGSFSLRALPGTVFERIADDAALFVDGRSRREPFLCLLTRTTASAGLRICGQLLERSTPAPQLLQVDESLLPSAPLSIAPGSSFAAGAARIAEMVPWYAQNAWVHYLSPRGLEQYSGGGWGTRDVCQGPVELLLALQRVAPIRDLLLRVMAQQNPDGDWPQWFMFFERERNIRPGDSHGDIVFWPLLVLAQYLTAGGSAQILEEPVRFFDPAGADQGETVTVWQHVLRALALINQRVIPGTALAAYGHGDWNDSLQPVDPGMRQRLCSSWTVTLQFQTLSSLAAALRGIGRDADALSLESQAQSVHRDFQRLLLPDGILAGYVHFEDGDPRYLLHPRDDTTGIHYSALGMIHAILEDLFTPAQARAHLKLIATHLSAPDGVRLFDRPMTYHGGRQRLFQRAETATYFGREIGLMYTHAHLRFAQALAHVGDAEGFFQALCQANPIALASVVPRATLRQANCYYSSSDAAFADRYQASEEYARVLQGTIDLDGGWRVYSSGAGIALSLILRRFFGISREGNQLRLDPVVPAALDGMRVKLLVAERGIEVEYRIGAAGCGVTQLLLNAEPLNFTRVPNPHRPGAVLTRIPELLERLRPAGNLLQVALGN